MKHRILDGREIADVIKERQARIVRGLKRSPKLAIVRTNSDQVIDIYLGIKQRYADAIGANVEVFQTSETQAAGVIRDLNVREDVDGIIVQLPLSDASKTDELLNLVSADKDVDGLAVNSSFDPATPTAILWLLASYNVELVGKSVLVVGQGRLVGAPLTSMLRASRVDATVADIDTNNLKEVSLGADIIITATGAPHTLTSDMISADTVIIDAGSASEKGVLIGDIDEDIRTRDDVSVTPLRGGVGPVTVAALFENLLSACRKSSM